MFFGDSMAHRFLPVDMDGLDAYVLSQDTNPPYITDPARRLYLERHVTNLEKSAFGSHPLPPMDEYANGVHFTPKLLGPSHNEVHRFSPPARYASSSGSIAGDQSCLSGHSWTDSHFCASPEATPLLSPLPSPSNYPEPLGSHSPMVGATGALFQGEAFVLPQDLQQYPDTLDVPPAQLSRAPRSNSYAQTDFSGWSSVSPEQCSPYQPPIVDPALFEQPPYEPNEPPRKRNKPAHTATHTSSNTSPSQPSVSWSSSSTSSQDAATITPEASQANRPNSNKKASPRNKRSSPQGRHSTNGVSFPCTFSPFGCGQTFTAKNEWKRHVATIHLQLGVYICDVGYCGNPPSSSPLTFPQAPPFRPPSPKTYNRKDLFTQHLKRMHAPQPTKPKTKLPLDQESALETFIRSTSERCFASQRSAPSYSQCPYCAADFSGPEIWDERMEHVARHVEEGAPRRREDAGLREWAVREGVVVAVQRGERREYVLVERVGGRKRKA